MEEKILKAKKGLMPLILLLAAYVLAIVALIGGISISVDNPGLDSIYGRQSSKASGSAGADIVWQIYRHTERGRHLLCQSVCIRGQSCQPDNITAKRRRQFLRTGDRYFQRRSESSDADQEDLAESNDAEQQQAEDQRLPGQSDRNRHCRYLACS